MALIKCKECNKEISDKAGKCPNCGCPINIKEERIEKNEKSQIKTGSILSLIANTLMLVMIICFIIFCFVNPNVNEEVEHRSGTSVQVQLTPSTVSFTYVIFLLISLLIALICVIMNIMYINKKIRNIKLYKISFIVLSIAELILSILSLGGFMCCGIVYLIYPIINFIGAIIIAVGKR